MTIGFVFALGIGLEWEWDVCLPRSHDSHVGRDGRLVAAAPRQSGLAVRHRLRCCRRRRNVGRHCRTRKQVGLNPTYSFPSLTETASLDHGHGRRC